MYIDVDIGELYRAPFILAACPDADQDRAMVSSPPATLGLRNLVDNGQAVHLCWMRTDTGYYRADGLSYIYIYNSTIYNLHAPPPSAAIIYPVSQLPSEA